MISVQTSLLDNRATIGRFKPAHIVDDATIAELVRRATLAPSAFHLQNWSFIAVRSAEAKARLAELAYGQRQVQDAGATFIVCGGLNACEALGERLQPSVDAGIITPGLQQTWVEMATSLHRDNPLLQRDEAIRSASLAGMAMLVAACEVGLDAGVLGGFDPEGVSGAFLLTPDEIPVMLVTVGRAADGNWPQKPRRPVGEVLSYR